MQTITTARFGTFVRSAVIDECKEFQKRSAEAISDQGVRSDQVLSSELAAPGTDRRFGVSLIARPSAEVLDHISRLQAISEELIRHGITTHLHFRRPSTHITFMRYTSELATNKKAFTDAVLNPSVQKEIQWQISDAHITWGAPRYGMRSRLKEAGPFAIGASSQQLQAA